MMRSVALRLTLFYLAIIMVLSIGFSFFIYRISDRELSRNLPPHMFDQFVSGDPTSTAPDFETFRTSRLDTSKRTLQANLVLLNLGTLALGAMISYGLARRTLRPIEEAFEAQGRFTADASHELRTPLTAMQTSIEVGLRNPKLSLPQSKTLLEGTLDEVKKLSSLANGLLKLSRNNAQDLPKKPVSLKQVAKEAAAQLELAAKNKGIMIRNEVPETKALGDDVSIKEIVVILLDNAIKYTGENTTITLSGTRSGKFAEIAVTDQGPGMKATDVIHIFDRFYRADSSRSRNHHVEGYGLGLSIAREITQAHGGALDVKSRLGEGSTFTVKLPLA